MTASSDNYYYYNTSEMLGCTDKCTRFSYYSYYTIEESNNKVCLNI